MKVKARTADLAESNEMLFAEISERKRAEEKLRELSKRDPLTNTGQPSFVVTNLSMEAQQLYEFYTKRGGTCEVRIDEFKNGLKTGRLSCHRFIANQFRLFLHMVAYWFALRLRHAVVKIRPGIRQF